MISEILYQQPAHRIGCKLCYLHVTDAKSLYDMSPNPSLSDKRSLVNVRAVQEKVSPQQMRWVPTFLMFADGLTKISVSFRQSMHDWLRAPSVKLKDEQGPKKTVGVTNFSRCFLCALDLASPQVDCRGITARTILLRILGRDFCFAMMGKIGVPAFRIAS